MSFLDYFSQHAGLYAEYRPTYPDALFAYLHDLAGSSRTAWDCATGNGQAAEGLSRYFEFVFASDASKEQILHAKRHPRLHYVVAIAEQPPLQSASMDLVTVAQALHWLNSEAFFKQVRRVLKPTGVIAAWCYNLLQVDPAVDEILNDFYWNTVGPYWPPERRLLEQEYRTIPFPFKEISPPLFYMEADWNLHDLLGYVSTWSAAQKYMRVKQSNPLELIAEKLASAWDDAETRRHIRWPLSVRVGACGADVSSVGVQQA